jgi:hypothetical protein
MDLQTSFPPIPILNSERASRNLPSAVLTDYDVRERGTIGAKLEFLPWYLWAEGFWCEFARDYQATNLPKKLTAPEVFWWLETRGLTDALGILDERTLTLDALYRTASDQVEITSLFQFAGSGAIVSAWKKEDVEAQFIMGTSTYWLKQGGMVIGVADIRGIPRWAPNELVQDFLDDAFGHVWSHLKPFRVHYFDRD